MENFVGLVACEYCGWFYVFTTHSSCTVTEVTILLEKKFASLRYFLLFLIIFVLIICYRETFFWFVVFWMFLYNLGWYLVHASVSQIFP